MDTEAPEKQHRLSQAYHALLHRLADGLREGAREAAPVVDKAIEKSKEKLAEAGEWTREELDEVAGYIRRDAEDAGEFLAEHGDAFADWLRQDLLVIEQSIVDALQGLADQTRVELAQWQQRADRLGEWHTGEITAPAVLRCTHCAEELHFHAPGHVPPCPACHGTRFKRVSARD